MRKRFLSIIFILTVFTLGNSRISTLASAGAGAVLDDMIKDADSENSSGSGDESKAGGISKLPEALACTFFVPMGFKASDEPGVFVNEHYPLESANITYEVSVLPEKKILTNAQRAAGESEDATNIEYRYDELAAEMYETIQKENYESLYGENIGFTLESFENMEYDGFPGYMIRTSYTPENSQTIHQAIAIVLSKNKVFTIVFSRAEDDDFEDKCTQTLDTIHVLAKK
ncbi:hypothetical protein [Butyrivibrio sp. INlla16]|uniref:hypothetical protein n=1 Tax=Butyrivibrio sp. INlla16 TaxID=1520807 RepID=UPI0008809589|nr:hypothetical protein [Butyrivibrio sp. INlla16]SDB07014.1 hypothetical protein SAMN02910263_00270 [Butyrivibrio sp. INlla16]